MINKKLIIAQIENFHFSWMNEEFKKYFKEVVVVSSNSYPANEDDILLANTCLGSFQDYPTKLKFGIVLPGFSFHPFNHPEHVEALKPCLSKYDAVFCDEAPVGYSFQRNGTIKNFHIVPICCNTRDFKKTRVRDKFKRIIQVASHGSEKGRFEAKAAMKLLPYEWQQYPGDTENYFKIPQNEMPNIFQNADGFLQPGRIGDPPGRFMDAKYTVSLIEAGLSGCIIFWHDVMGIGNSMKTVFEVPLNPKGMAERIKDVVSSIDLEKHSILTAEEFREKHSIENTVRAKMEIIQRFL